MNFVLATITTVLIAVLAAAFAAPYLVDWNEYRSVFEAEASKLVGRPVRVSGDVNLTILPVPEVRFEEVHIADKDGGLERPFAQADAFKMILSLPPLLSGTVEARKIEIVRPIFRLRLDNEGRGNWEGMGGVQAALPFIPRRVTLKSVTIKNGTIELERPDGAPRWWLDELNGELTAETLRGPYKFHGHARIDGQVRELSLTTGRPGPDGDIRIKASALGAGTAYLADGALRGLGRETRFEGEITARAPLGESNGQTGAGEVEAKARGRVGIFGAKLGDLSITVTRRDRPQTVTGQAEIDWSRTLRIDAAFTSRWLDLDLLTDATARHLTPADLAAQFPEFLRSLPFQPGEVQIDARFPQLSVGGDLIRDLSARVRFGEAGWIVERMEAGLPGDTDVRFDGTFSRTDGRVALVGKLDASGRNLGRLLRWAAPKSFSGETGAAQYFALQGDITASRAKLQLTNMQARMGDSRVTGTVSYAYGPQARLVVDLSSDRLDLRPLMGEMASADLASRMLGETPSPEQPAGAQDAETFSAALWQPVRSGEFMLDLRVGHLSLPEIDIRDMDARLRLTPGALDIERLSFYGSGGLKLDTQGRFGLGKASRPLGTALRLTLTAENPEAIAGFSRLLPASKPYIDRHLPRLKALTPIHVAGTLSRSAPEKVSVLRLDGLAGNSQIELMARIENGGDTAIHRAPVHIVGRIYNPHAGALFRQIAPAAGSSLPAPRSGGEASIRLDAEGTLADALQGEVRLNTQEIKATLTGSLTLGPGEPQFRGKLSARSDSASSALGLFGLAPPKDTLHGGLELQASVTAASASYDFRQLSLKLGGQSAMGHLSIGTKSGKLRVHAEMIAGKAALPPMLAYLISGEAPDLATAELGSDGDFWPNRPFSLQLLDRLSCEIKLAAGRLRLAGDLVLRKAGLRATLENGTLTLASLDGELLGGTFKASGRLARELGRITFGGKLAVDGLDLAQLPSGPGGNPLASGRGELQLSLKSEGISPRGLIAVLKGDGRIKLTSGSIRGLNAGVLARIAHAYMSAAEPPKEKVTAQLAELLKAESFKHGPAETGISVENGNLRIKGAYLRALEGTDSVRADVIVDLSSLRLDSEWRLHAGPQGDLKLPAVRVVFAGPLAEFGRIEPAVEAEEFEQYLTVQRLERDVEQLEQMELPRPHPPSAMSDSRLLRDTPSAQEDRGGQGAPLLTPRKSPPGGDTPDPGPAHALEADGTSEQPAPDSPSTSVTTTGVAPFDTSTQQMTGFATEVARAPAGPSAAGDTQMDQVDQGGTPYDGAGARAPGPPPDVPSPNPARLANPRLFQEAKRALMEPRKPRDPSRGTTFFEIFGR